MSGAFAVKFDDGDVVVVDETTAIQARRLLDGGSTETAIVGVTTIVSANRTLDDIVITGPVNFWQHRCRLPVGTRDQGTIAHIALEETDGGYLIHDVKGTIERLLLHVDLVATGAAVRAHVIDLVREWGAEE